jgi:hypothetical protein
MSGIGKSLAQHQTTTPPHNQTGVKIEQQLMDE